VNVSWRIVEEEGEVYEILNQNKVQNVPQCVDLCDVGDALFHQTQVQIFARAVWLPEDFRPSNSLLRHHRLILDAVGEGYPHRSNRYVDCANAPTCHSLTYFSSAHADQLGILHYDISLGNILITRDSGNGGSEDFISDGGGILVDWDLCSRV